MQKQLTFFSTNISVYAVFNDQSFNYRLLMTSLVLNNWAQINIFLYFFMKPFLLGTLEKYLTEVLLMSTHNFCFQGEKKNISPVFGEKKNKTKNNNNNKKKKHLI